MVRIAKYQSSKLTYWNCLDTIKINLKTRNKTLKRSHFYVYILSIIKVYWHHHPTPPATNSCMLSPVSPHKPLFLSSLSFLSEGPSATFNLRFIFLQCFLTEPYQFCSYFVPSFSLLHFRQS